MLSYVSVHTTLFNMSKLENVGSLT